MKAGSKNEEINNNCNIGTFLYFNIEISKYDFDIIEPIILSD